MFFEPKFIQEKNWGLASHHDTQENDTQHNNTWHNDAKHN